MRAVSKVGAVAMKPGCVVAVESAANSVTGSKPATRALPPSTAPKLTARLSGQDVGVEQVALGLLAGFT